MRKNFSRSINGFTLIEALAAIAIFSVLMLAILAFAVYLYQYQGADLRQIQATEQARRGIEKITREIREARRSANGSYPIEQVQNQSLIIYADPDNDNVIERLRYFLESSTLKEGVIKPSGSPLTYSPANEVIKNIATNVANNASEPIFYYYDKNYQGTGNPLSFPVNIADIRLVRVFLKIDAEAAWPPPPFNLEGVAQIRTLKDNL